MAGIFEKPLCLQKRNNGPFIFTKAVFISTKGETVKLHLQQHQSTLLSFTPGSH